MVFNSGFKGLILLNKKWTDWFKWSFTSIFLNAKWTEIFKWRITLIFLNIQWTDRLKWVITSIFLKTKRLADSIVLSHHYITVVTRGRVVSGSTHFKLLNKQWWNFLWDANIHVSYYFYQNLPWNSSPHFHLCISTFILLTNVKNALNFKLNTWFK
jgi:hypothetical protein